MKELNNWGLTDDDSQQYVKEISSEESPHTFELIEIGLINPEDEIYQIYTNSICVEDYLETARGELKEIINSYGYYLDDEDNYDGFCIWNYKEEAYQVMAECIFEYYGSFEAEQLFIGAEKECIDFVQNYIKNN